MTLLRGLFDGAAVAVRIRGQMSRRIPMGRGLLQGSLLSPMLFNVFIDSLPRVLRRRHPGFLLGSCRANSFLYADDIVLVSSSEKHLQSMLDTCEQHGIEHGYVFSPSKCEIIAPEGAQTSYLRMYEEQVKQSPRFKYLGSRSTIKALTQRGCAVRAFLGQLRLPACYTLWDAMGQGFRLRLVGGS